MNYRKIPNEIEAFLPQILDQARNGITITNPNEYDNPIIYANKAFCQMFEYNLDELLGVNCRFLHKEDRDQLGIKSIRETIKKQKSTTVTLRNYTKSNILKYIEITVSPIFDEENNLRFFLGVQKDVTNEQKLLQQIKGLI